MVAKVVEPATTHVLSPLPNPALTSTPHLTAEKHPVAISNSIQVVDRAPPVADLHNAVNSDSHHPTRAHVGADLSQGISGPAIARLPERVVISAHPVVDHTDSDTAVHVSYSPPFARDVATSMQGHYMEGTLAASATEWTSMEADHGRRIGGWEKDLPRDSGIITIVKEHTDSDDIETVFVSVYRCFLYSWASLFVIAQRHRDCGCST